MHQKYKIKNKVIVFILAAAICMIGMLWQRSLEVSAASKSGWVTASSLTVRSKASVNSAKRGYLHKGDKITIKGTSGNFYRITYKNKKSYVSKSYVSTTKASSTSKSGWITANSLTVRSKASVNSAKRGYLHKGDKITIKGTSGNFYRITYKSKKSYVSKSYVSTKKISVKSTKKTTGSDIIAYAKQFVGNPYKWGGTSLTKGADCSGFVQSVYKHFGYSLPRTSSSQRSAGKGVKWSNRKAGDIICYSGHVALYIGNNKIVHANSSRTGIITSSVYIGKKVLAVRRIL